MTGGEALDVVRRLQAAVQKCRSNGLEALGGLGGGEEALLELLQPWLFGERCLLRATEPILERGAVDGITLYNLMTIVDRDAALRQWCGVWAAAYGAPDFPLPEDVAPWLCGWDAA